MLSPKVSPPMPHRTPKRYVHRSVFPDADPSTPSRSGHVSRPTTQGTTIQLKVPPTSQ